MLLKLVILLIVLVLLVFSVSKWKLHPFLALLLAALALGLSFGLGGKETVEVVLTGFGNTMKWIAIVVILGAFIGEVLRDTEGAQRISRAIVRRTGEKKLPWAMGFTGYLVSIPVFVDVAYIVLQPVTEALAARTKTPILVIGLALTAGLTVSHTLIPPTPGPLAVASSLNVEIGSLLLINAFVGIFAMTGGIIWASRYCRKFVLPYDEKLAARAAPDTKESISKNTPVFMDLLPILVPIALMGLGALYKAEGNEALGQIIEFVSMPMIAVLLGSAIAWIQFTLLHKKTGIHDLVEQAIVKSALVIMITGAGGALGAVIKASGLQDSLAEYFITFPFLGFFLPFLIAAVLTTSTGSITVSLIGTASIMGPLANSMNYSPEIMAALIGCGAFCVFHANSSFFWLLHKLHEVPVQTLYRTFTLQSLVMGISGLLGVVILYALGVG